MLSSIIVFVIVLSILILVHELGHFMAAKKAGLLVEEFGFGIPPRVIGKKFGETIYSINLLPFGGFVRIHGQSEAEKVSVPTRAFYTRPKKTRAFIVVAGILMNILLGIVAFAFVYTFSGIPRTTEDVKIVDVNPDSPAQKSGFETGDIVRMVDQVTITSTSAFIDEIGKYKGEKVDVKVQRKINGKFEEEDLIVTPRVDYPSEEGPLGVTITQTEIYFPPL